MAEEARPRLGRGLAALIGDAGSEVAAIDRLRGQRLVPIEFLRPNPRNPRKDFKEAELDDLSASIKERGILQPILVRSITGVADAYEIVAGERRWRAAQRANVHDVPIILIEADEKAALEIAVIENVQRADLNALEEAMGYEQLGNEFGYSQGDLARIIGKSRSHIANTLRLLKLPTLSRRMLAEGHLSAGHARALLSVSDPDAVARRIAEQGLSVRDVERITQQETENSAGRTKTKTTRREKDADTRALEKDLSNALGLAVSIDVSGERGEVRIRYKDLEQLDALCVRLKG
ncbi:MAG: ParB family transcriptional regulator, chromosome partitioning protein [Methylobacteriaceae bacterium]|jgi:ParB family chromosome partitioning protein|nr:ParB family transcriptional regulator, chromosome partitioning protein [Methylobacteriaceae bacterium]